MPDRRPALPPPAHGGGGSRRAATTAPGGGRGGGQRRAVLHPHRRDKPTSAASADRSGRCWALRRPLVDLAAPNLSSDVDRRASRVRAGRSASSRPCAGGSGTSHTRARRSRSRITRARGSFCGSTRRRRRRRRGRNSSDARDASRRFTSHNVARWAARRPAAAALGSPTSTSSASRCSRTPHIGVAGVRGRRRAQACRSARRIAVLVDEGGRIARIYDPAGTGDFPAKVLADLKQELR